MEVDTSDVSIPFQKGVLVFVLMTNKHKSFFNILFLPF